MSFLVGVATGAAQGLLNDQNQNQRNADAMRRSLFQNYVENVVPTYYKNVEIAKQLAQRGQLFGAMAGDQNVGNTLASSGVDVSTGASLINNSSISAPQDSSTASLLGQPTSAAANTPAPSASQNTNQPTPAQSSVPNSVSQTPIQSQAQPTNTQNPIGISPTPQGQPVDRSYGDIIYNKQSPEQIGQQARAMAAQYYNVSPDDISKMISYRPTDSLPQGNLAGYKITSTNNGLRQAIEQLNPRDFADGQVEKGMALKAQALSTKDPAVIQQLYAQMGPLMVTREQQKRDQIEIASAAAAANRVIPEPYVIMRGLADAIKNNPDLSPEQKNAKLYELVHASSGLISNNPFGDNGIPSVQQPAAQPQAAGNYTPPKFNAQAVADTIRSKGMDTMAARNYALSLGAKDADLQSIAAILSKNGK